jgi:hypothetical protein
MKAADDDRYAKRPKLPAEIECAGKLVGLHAHQADHAAAAGANPLCHGAHVDNSVGLVASFDLDIDVPAEHALSRTLGYQPIDAR